MNCSASAMASSTSVCGYHQQDETADNKYSSGNPHEGERLAYLREIGGT